MASALAHGLRHGRALVALSGLETTTSGAVATALAHCAAGASPAPCGVGQGPSGALEPYVPGPRELLPGANAKGPGVGPPRAGSVPEPTLARSSGTVQTRTYAGLSRGLGGTHTNRRAPVWSVDLHGQGFPAPLRWAASSASSPSDGDGDKSEGKPTPEGAPQATQECGEEEQEKAEGSRKGGKASSAPSGKTSAKEGGKPRRSKKSKESSGVDEGSEAGEDPSGPEAAPESESGSETVSLGTGCSTPAELVGQLDRHIVGQSSAKRAVAIALRNRWRRLQLEGPMRLEVQPRNILMVGPTGCGKTEIARRLAKLADAPFTKVEATKFTEVGFVGRDVDSIIRDLVEASIQLVKARLRAERADAIAAAVDDALVRAITSEHDPGNRNYQEMMEHLKNGNMENLEVTIKLPPPPPAEGSNIPPEATALMNAMKQMTGGGKPEERTMKVSEARKALEEAEMAAAFAGADVVREAIASAESHGIVVIDEIDKIVADRRRSGPDASAEGVQRDLLPLIEGSLVSTKHGNVKTDHILFICSGAFHAVRPESMLAELKGRLPIRVTLEALTEADFYRILTEPESNVLAQQQALLRTEGVELSFTDAAVREIARSADQINRTQENIGARRLHTIVELIMEDISFDAPERAKAHDGAGPLEEVVDVAHVRDAVKDLLRQQDLSRYII